MADEQQSASGMFPGFFQEFIGQLRATTERLEDLGRFGGRLPSAPGAPVLPTLPGAFSAAQMTSITDSIAAQRRSIEALKTQLSSYDEQLAVLEQALGPFAEWSRTWAEFEQQVLNMGQKPASGQLPAAGPVNWGPARIRSGLERRHPGTRRAADGRTRRIPAAGLR
jgi:hypothetical protein